MDMSNRQSVLERLLKSEEGDLSPDLAEYLLRLDFSLEDHARYLQLSAQVQNAGLTPDEEAELDELLVANDVLVILKGKARLSLKRRTPAA